MHKFFLCFTLVFISFITKAQKEWVNWNSSSGGLSFKSDSGVLYNDVPKNSAWPDYQGQKAVSYSDPVTGEMLFLTDGKYIWNKNYKAIIDSFQTLISCDSDYYKIQIVPFVNDPSKFYLFHLYSAKGFVTERQGYSGAGCNDSILSNLYYSVLQMDFINNTGKLIVKNKPILKNPLDRVTLVKHANKKDTWVIAHAWDSSHFTAFLVTDTLIHEPVISVIGPEAPLPWNNIRGNIVASPDGKTIAVSSSNAAVEIYDFNNSTGTLRNFKAVSLTREGVSSLCFSPDNTKLYIAVLDYKSCEDYCKVYQVDLTEPDLNKSLFLVKRYYRKSLELSKAKDNRIWIKGASYMGDSMNHFDVIEYPNLPKHACIIKEKYFSYGSNINFPNIISDYIQQATEKKIVKMNFPDTIKVCFGKASLDADAGYESYIWNTGETTRSIAITQPGLYTVLAGKKGFPKPEAYGYVYVKSTGAEVFNATDTFFCPKTLHVLKVPESITNILWMDGDTSRVKFVENNQYKITGIDNKGCVVWDSICIAIHDKPFADFGNDTTLCPHQSLKLNFKTYGDSSNPQSANAAYLWQDGSTKNSFTIKQAGTYWGGIKFSGCTVADTIKVNYVSIPDVDLGKDSNLCVGDNLKLYVEPSTAAYLWSTGSTSNTITAATSGKYWVKVSKSICVNKDTIQLSFNSYPVISLSKDTSLCEGTSLILSPSNDTSYKYKWQDGTTANTFKVTKGGTYSVAAINKVCVTADTVKVDYISLPNVNLGKDTSLCEGNSIALSVEQSNANYLWSTGNTSNKITIAKAGTYWVKISQNKCFKTDTVELNFRPLPVISLPKDTVLCEGASMVLSPSSNTDYKYKWQNGDTTNNLPVTTGGTYSVIAKYNGCAAADTTKVDYISLPDVKLGRDTSLCEGDSLTLSIASSDAKYLWNTGYTTNRITVNKSGNYWVKISKSVCFKADTIQLNLKPLPVIALPKDTVICAGTSLTLSPSSNTAYTYKWQNGDISDKFSVTSGGKYSVSVNYNGCFTSASTSVDVMYQPYIKLFDTAMCKTEQLLLDPHVAVSDQVIWQNQSTQHTYLVKTPGIYSVKAYNNCGSDFKQIEVTERLCKIIMPTAFTPNADRLNDEFKIRYPEVVKSFQLSLYNRLGQKIFQTTNPYKGWDGTINGIQQPMGTYIWQLKYTDIENNSEVLTGYVLMLR